MKRMAREKKKKKKTERRACNGGKKEDLEREKRQEDEASILSLLWFHVNMYSLLRLDPSGRGCILYQ